VTQKRPAHRRKHADDPLVPISGRHVRALLEQAKLSERDAVDALGHGGVRTAQATIDHIVRGRQSRCRASLRNGLAALLGAPLAPEWLGGEYDKPLWWGTDAGTDLNARARPNSPLGRAINRAREHYEVPTRDPLGLPPLYELAAYQLVRDVDHAWQRANGDELDVLQLIRRLLSLALWRRWLLPDHVGGVIEDEDMDRFAAAMGEALRILLQPWLDAESQIRKDRLPLLQAALDHIRRAVAREGAAVRAVDPSR
jgi:hypothetical protein